MGPKNLYLAFLAMREVCTMRSVYTLRASRRALSKNWEPIFIGVIKMEEIGATASVKAQLEPRTKSILRK